jgi:hypothetical protein
MNAERMARAYNALLSIMANTIGQRDRIPPCLNEFLVGKIRHAIAPVAWNKNLRQHRGERNTKVNVPEQITLVAIVKKKYAAVHDFTSWEMSIPGCALPMYETETAPIALGGAGGVTLNSGVNVTAQIPVSNLIPV